MFKLGFWVMFSGVVFFCGGIIGWAAGEIFYLSHAGEAVFAAMFGVGAVLFVFGGLILIFRES